MLERNTVSDRLPPHNWRWEDEIIAFCLSRIGTGEISLEDVDRKLGICPEAMRMRIGRFTTLAEKGDFAKLRGQSRAVFEKYRDASDDELRLTALSILHADAWVKAGGEPLQADEASNRRCEYEALRTEMRECLERSFQITVGYVTLSVAIMAYGFSNFQVRGPIFVLPITVVWLGKDIWNGLHAELCESAAYIVTFIEPACSGMHLETAWWERRRNPLKEAAAARTMLSRIMRFCGLPDVPQVPALLLVFTTGVFVFWLGLFSDWHWAVRAVGGAIAVALARYVFRAVVAYELGYSPAKFQQELDRWSHARDALERRRTRTHRERLDSNA